MSLCGVRKTPPRPHPTHHRACIHQSLHCHTRVSKPRGDACQRRCVWLWLCLFTCSLTLLLSGQEKRVRVEDSVCVCATATAAAAPAQCVAAITLHRGQRLLSRLPRDVKAVCTVCEALLIDVCGVRVCACVCVCLCVCVCACVLRVSGAHAPQVPTPHPSPRHQHHHEHHHPQPPRRNHDLHRRGGPCGSGSIPL